MVTGVSAGSATITYSVTNTCGTATATKSITVNPLANAGTITGASSLCAGATTTLSSNGDAGGTWSSDNSAVATVNASGVVTGVSAGSATITYTVTNTCGTATATKSITVNPNANAGTISGASSVCAGVTTTLSSSGDAGGTWSSDNTAAATVNSSGVVTGVNAGSATITYTVTNNCGTATATKSITVNPNANAGTISGASSVCTGSTITLSSNGDAGGSWSSDNTAVATVDGNGLVMGVSTGNATITYTVTNTCGTANATKTIAVNVCSSTVNIKMFIQGYYQNIGSPTPMDNFGAGGCLFVTGLSANVNDADSVTVCLIDPNTLSQVDCAKGILQTNGQLSVSFAGSVTGNYYLKVTHRNTIETWSAQPVDISLGYDFTTNSNKAYGGNMVEMEPGIWAFYSGDIADAGLGLGFQDNVVESSDYSEMENAVYLVLTGYIIQDITGDGVVESSDYSIMENNTYLVISSIHP